MYASHCAGRLAKAVLESLVWLGIMFLTLQAIARAR